MPSEDISKVAKRLYWLIDEELKKGNVYVHCVAGISRSASVVIYYVMKKLKYDLPTAIDYV